MSTETNKNVVRALVSEVKNRANPARAAELLSQGYIHHFHTRARTLHRASKGRCPVGEIFGEAFPTIEVTLEVLVAEDDYVLERSSAVAFMEAPCLASLQPTRT